MTSEAICIGDRPVVAVVDGKIDPGAVEGHVVGILQRDVRVAIAEMDIPTREVPAGLMTETRRPVRLAVDVDARFETIVDIAYNMTHLEINDYWFALEQDDGTSSYVETRGPMLGQGPNYGVAAYTDGLHTAITGEPTKIGPIPEALLKPGTREVVPLPGLRAGLAKATEDEADLVPVNVTASSGQPFRVFASTIVAAAGPECPLDQPRDTWARPGCVASAFVLAAGL